MKDRWAALRERYEDWRDQRLENEGSAAAQVGFGIGKVVGSALLFLIIYFFGGALYFHEINDDPDYPIPEKELISGGSRTVSMVAALIDREVNQIGWDPQNPWFYPTALLDNQPNFQKGMIRSMGRFAFELSDQLGRVRGSSIVDTDLQKVSGELQIAPDIWMFNNSIMPTQSSDDHYRNALKNLRRYNERVAQGTAVFDRRADNLLATLERIAADLGSSSAAIDQYVTQTGGAFIDRKVDDLFYDIKGSTYTYHLILRELGEDFASIIREKGLTQSWNNMLTSTHAVAGMDPISVQNGDPGSYLFPNHLLNQGFFLMRARTQLREISDILIK